MESSLERSRKPATRRVGGEKARQLFIQGATCHSTSANASMREEYCKRGQQAAVKIAEAFRICRSLAQWWDGRLAAPHPAVIDALFRIRRMTFKLGRSRLEWVFCAILSPSRRARVRDASRRAGGSRKWLTLRPPRSFLLNAKIALASSE